MKDKQDIFSDIVKVVVISLFVFLATLVYLQGKRIEVLMEKIELLQEKETLIIHEFSNFRP